MKKFMIIGLTFLVASVVSCKNTKDIEDKEEVPAPVEAVEETKSFTITNTTAMTIVVTAGDISEKLAKDACVKVEEADFEKLMVSKEANADLATAKTAADAVEADATANSICDSTNDSKKAACKAENSEYKETKSAVEATATAAAKAAENGLVKAEVMNAAEACTDLVKKAETDETTDAPAKE